MDGRSSSPAPINAKQRGSSDNIQPKASVPKLGSVMLQAPIIIYRHDAGGHPLPDPGILAAPRRLGPMVGRDLARDRRGAAHAIRWRNINEMRSLARKLEEAAMELKISANKARAETRAISHAANEDLWEVACIGEVIKQLAALVAQKNFPD